MALDFDSTIENEVNSSNLSAVDLVIVNFGNDIYRFWSTTQVDAQYYTFEGFPNNTRPAFFQARIVNIGQKSWGLDGYDNEVTFEIAHRLRHDDRDIEKLIALNGGAKLFENAKVELWRCLPNIRRVYQIWQGTGNAPEWNEFTFEWSVQFMPNNLMQSFGRALEQTCPFNFGDQIGCSYKLLKGRGLPEARYTWAHSGDVTPSGNTYVVSGSNFNVDELGQVKAGWFLHNRTKNCYFKVKSYDSSTQLTTTWYHTGHNGTKEIKNGDILICGPYFSSCSGIIADCKARGRFGSWQNDGNNDPLYVSDGRREFGGITQASNVRYRGTIPGTGKIWGGGGEDPFHRIPSSQESTDGSIVPVVFGPYRLNGVKSLSWGPAGNFQHGFFLLCEGVQFDIGAPYINEHGPDVGNDGASNTTDKIMDEPFMKFNVWRYGSVFGSSYDYDRLNEDPNNERHVRRIRWGIGERKAYFTAANEIFDSYGEGLVTVENQPTHLGIPYLFNNGFGDGHSWTGMTAARVRIETGEDNLEQLSGSFDLAGTLYEVPFGWHRMDSADNKFDIADGGWIYRYTIYPDYALAAYHILTNPIWGGGMGWSNLNMDSFISFSRFCIGDEDGDGVGDVFNFSATNSLLEHTIDQYGPFGCMVYNWDINIEAFIHYGVLFYDSDDEDTANTFVARIVQADNISAGDTIPDFAKIASHYIDISANTPDQCIAFTIDREFGSFQPYKFKIFGAGDYTTGAHVRRWHCNGALTTTESIYQVLTNVLDEAAANWRMDSDGKIEVVYRRALSDTEVADIISDRFFTDKGANRNILRDTSTSQSTLKCWRKDVREIANEYSVTFTDASRSYLATKVTVRSKTAQLEAARRFGETNSRRRIQKEVELPLTSSISQAARRLALMVREEYYANFYCSFQTSLKTAAPIQCGDIICVESEVLINKFQGGSVDITAEDDGPLFFRVLKITEDDKFVRNFECQIHLNSIYDDSTINFDQDIKVVVDWIDVSGTGIPAAVTPSTPSVDYNTTNTGDLEVIISTEITYPKIKATVR